MNYPNPLLKTVALSLKQIAVCLLLLPIVAEAANGPRKRTPDEVLLVYNTNSLISKAIADDYSARRKTTNVLSIQCQDSAMQNRYETITLSNYTQQIETPIRGYLSHHANINFIVLTKGIPIRIRYSDMGSCDEHSQGPEATRGHPSVDSYLAALDYTNLPAALKIYITGSGAIGRAYSNRFWNAIEPFSHAKYGGYLVTRLDGYTEEDAKALTTRSLEAEKRMTEILKQGEILLDVQPDFGVESKTSQADPIISTNISTESPWREFNVDMRHAAEMLTARGLPVELDLKKIFVGGRSNLLGYFSWGSNDSHYKTNAYQTLFFAPGSFCDTAVSTSARTFLPTRGGQSLITDLIAHGATCVKGYVDEPLLQANAAPSIAFDRYTAGFTMAESYYAAAHFVCWEDIVIGDPLCCPYSGMFQTKL